MRFPRAIAAATAALAILLLTPATLAHHECEVACVGGIWHEEGDGTCPGEAADSFLIFGAEGLAAGDHYLVGVGWTCEDHAAERTDRAGAFVYLWDEGGAPVELLFFGIEHEGDSCMASAGVIGVYYEGSPHIHCALS